jgi:hypothetical protein
MKKQERDSCHAKTAIRELSLFNGGRATRMVVKPLEKQ